MAEPARMIPLQSVRWRLGLTWFVGAGLIAVLLAIQSLFNVYGDNVAQVWGWALPNLIPTLSLVLGVLAAAALTPDDPGDGLSVRNAFFWLAMGLSLVHLLGVLSVILVHPLLYARLAEGADNAVMRPFQLSNLWLGPLQGLVAGALSALFFTKSPPGAPGRITP